METLLSIEAYQELYQHIYTVLGGCENIPASFSQFQERIDRAAEPIEQDTAMSLFSAAYKDVTTRCNHSLKHTLSYLQQHHSTNYRKIIEVIIWLGGHCDCEVVMNVSPIDYALRYNEPIDGEMSEWEWNRLVDNFLYRAGYRQPSTKRPATAIQQGMLC